jgi:aldose 1-epimerase
MMDTAAARIFKLEHPGGLRIAVMDIGATWLSCEVPLAGGTHREVLLGCDSAEDYAGQTAYLGAIIGRYANRITNARFTLDGQEYLLTANNGPNNLHGGPEGFDRQRWTLVSHSATELVLAIDSPDGDQGFPGRAQVQVRYALTDAGTVQIDFRAEVDKACPIALTSHAYFNLDGVRPDGDIRTQTLRITAERYVPVDATLAPLGEPADVAGTPFDFRTPCNIGAAWPDAVRDNEQLRNGAGYDHSFLLDEACRHATVPAAELASADWKLTMRVYTDQPAIQCYTGNFLTGIPARGGQQYSAHAGIALEPGYPPDSPNQPVWSGCILRPGQVGKGTIRFVFEVAT